MKYKVFHILLLFSLVFGALAPVTQVQAASNQTQADLTSPQELLNSDGTLDVSQGFNGTLDLNGYSVSLDPKRGPVFGPMASVQAGQWAGVGAGGGAIDGGVRAIVVDGTDVYVAGSFTDAGSIPEADYVAKWDGSNWSALGADNWGNGSLNSDVNSMVMIGSDLYVGGWFSQIYDQSYTPVTGSAYVAKWSTLTNTWSGLGDDGANGASLNNGVNVLAVSGTDLYVAGSFTNVNNHGTVIPEADYIAKWDGSDWSALGSNGAGNGSIANNPYIDALAVMGSDLYVGGNFNNVNDGDTPLTAADRIARWDGSHWHALGSNGAGEGAISGTVFTMAVMGTDLYVGGQFADVNNNGDVLNAGDWLVRWDTLSNNWFAVGSGNSGNGSLNQYATSLFVNGTDLYVGGGFTNVNDNGTIIPEADYLAKWDGSHWSALGSNGASDGAIPGKPSAGVAAMAMQNGNLLIGGWFYDISDGGSIQPQADYLAKWDGSNWSAFNTETNGALVNGYSGSQVYAIAVIGTDVYVGGRFIDISNHGINIPEGDNIVKWDGTDWSALGSDGHGDGALQGNVYALAVMGTDLYVGGQFTNLKDGNTTLNAADYIAKWDTLTGHWSALGSNGSGNGAIAANGGSTSVQSLAVHGTDLYVGGNFTDVNDNGTPIPEADYIAKWNTVTNGWSALGSNGSNGALNGGVSALALDTTGNLYAGGWFENAAGISEADFIAKWNGANWSALGDNNAGNGSLNKSVWTIAVSGSDVYAGGIFTNVNNHGTVLPAADLVAKWDGTDWSALGSNGMNDGVFCVGCGSSISSIFVDGTDIYIGGNFENLRSNNVTLPAADYIAKWDGSQWSALGSNGAGDGSILTVYGVYDITRLGSDLLVGGLFSNVNNNGTIVKEADYLAAYGLTVSTPDTTPPTVVSVTRASPNPTSAASVDFTVTFSEDIYFPWPTVFVVTETGVTGAAVTGWDGSGSIYTIHVSTGSGSGSIGLDVIDNDTIVDAAGNPLGGPGAGNGTYTGGETYTVTDTSIPAVQSINRANPSPTLGPAATFAVTFSEPVTGVDQGDFILTSSGLTNPTITSVLGSGASYTVITDTGTGSGTLRLDLVDDNTIFDLLSHPLGGAGAGNGNFNTGQSYKVRTTTFGDVPTNYWSWQFIERLHNAGITGGCSNLPMMYCPGANVTRAQMAVFLLVAEHGSGYTPPAATGLFNDVPATDGFAKWIEQMAAEGITGGCGDGNYCPNSPVTRAQMAVFLLVAKHGTGYTPPAASGVFSDVPVNDPFAPWIEQLAAEGITGGCGGGNYCPNTVVNRGQMAVFLVTSFYLP